ncbi:hypothetical protein AGMMS50233_02900 [Endomicrobiia bacterium]|nr:hypothetical protein AGMMS50233_02900 [Endomicrobiia bacterium]
MGLVLMGVRKEYLIKQRIVGSKKRKRGGEMSREKIEYRKIVGMMF